MEKLLIIVGATKQRIKEIKKKFEKKFAIGQGRKWIMTKEELQEVWSFFLQTITTEIERAREEAKKEGREEILKLADGLTDEKSNNLRRELLDFEKLMKELSQSKPNK